MIPYLLTGLSLGLASSLHCVGMCGPLALALPVQAFPPAKKIYAIALYHTGRIASYTALGLIAGLIGQQVSLAGYQQWFSIAVGIGLLATLFFYARKRHIGNRSFLYRKVQGFMVQHMQHPTLRGIWLTGMGNGLLPCGMVYMAIAAALTSDSMLAASGTMLFFGLGTLPLMTMVSLTAMYLRPSARNRIRKISPLITAFLGVLLILRGLNLDIPYLSPLLRPLTGAPISCHP
ncbi:sulfite exporter TauE/SafE family protein [Sediminibacterium soli]|uniref:sulfite exporter TauE/SafE family protein n=1 Tax=Sediminibacterium soli TaxID=2698829 RepID=UPI00137A5463|nr:sulfite exporter TauE/SafE family protein [Sediminibacterium soli]NCI45684.1 sulfite exporter TauE/SafE family protein [Sediminibacterium soli]